MKFEEYTPKTFEDLACYWIYIYATTHKTASSVKRDQGILRNYLLPAFDTCNLSELTPLKVEQWFAQLAQTSTNSPKSKNLILGLFKKILSNGERWGFIKKNPASGVKNLKLADQDYDYWSAEETRTYLGVTLECCGLGLG